jgi:glutamate-ammonia-ligase adenylyltransferase
VKLSAAYDFLRRVEHRLQYLDDAQTHMLPTEPRIAPSSREPWAMVPSMACWPSWTDHRADVARHFEAVFADPNRGEHKLAGMWRGAGGRGPGTEEFAKLGYRQPAKPRCSDSRRAARRAALPAAFAASIRERFDALVPQLIQAAAGNAEPGRDALAQPRPARSHLAPRRLPGPAAAISAGAAARWQNWSAVRAGRPSTCSATRSCSTNCSTRACSTCYPTGAACAPQLEAMLAELEPDTERQMDLLRETHHAQVFRLLAQDVAGLVHGGAAGRPPLRTGRHPARRSHCAMPG